MTEKRAIRFGETLTRRQETRRVLLLCGPALGWITFFLVLPMVGIVAVGFTSRGAYGQLQWSFTLSNIRRLLGFGALGFDPVYVAILLRSLALAAGTAFLCALFSFPLAFFVAGLPRRAKQTALLLVVIPFWTNLLIRTYAWQILLSSTGWAARLGAVLGWLRPGEGLYPSTAAVFLGLTCDYLPFLALPLYASVEKIDWTIAEAARDLGANHQQVFWHALLPQVRPGLMAGLILVFVPATGQFVIPDLLGGSKTVLLGSAIQQQFGPSRDWPFGSVMASVAMIVVMVGLWAYARVARSDERAPFDSP